MKNCLPGYEEVVKEALEKAEWQDIIQEVPNRFCSELYIISNSLFYSQSLTKSSWMGPIGRWIIKRK